MDASVNSEFPLRQLVVCQLPVYGAHHAGMPKTTTMADRIREAKGADSTRTVAQKVVLHGGEASHSAVQKWLAGGEIEESNLIAFCQAYGVSPAYIRYGVTPAPHLTEPQEAAAKLVGNDPPPWVQMGFDFMRTLSQKSVLEGDPRQTADYLRWLDQIIGGEKK